MIESKAERPARAAESAIRTWYERPAAAVLVPIQFRVGDGLRETASDISARGLYRINYHQPVELREPFTWTEDPFADRSWCLYFHSLAPVCYLAQSADQNGDLRHLAAARRIVEAWLSADEEGRLTHEMARHEHAVAMRAMALAHFAEVYRRLQALDVNFVGRLLRALERHGETLANPKNYHHGHNHGIDQDRALLAVALTAPHLPAAEDWIRLALLRLERQVRETILPDGVYREHSPDYEVWAFLQLAEIRDYLVAHGRPAEALANAAERMVEKITHSIRPDGTLPPVGDTVSRRPADLERYVRAMPNPPGELLYALTCGAEGQAPARRNLLLPRSGVAIFRQTWDPAKRGEALHAYFTAAFNTRAHKHQDDLSLVVWALGREWLVDGGRYTYHYDDPVRRYCESVFAHNTVIVNNGGTDLRRTNVGRSGVTATFEGSDVTAVDAVHYLYEDVEIRRFVAYIAPGLMLIFDRVYGVDSVSATQQFLFAPDLLVLQHGQRVHARTRQGGDSASGVQMLQLLQGGAAISLVRGATEPQRGWVSRAPGKVEPCTAVQTTADGQHVAFVTVMQFQRAFDGMVPLRGTASWDGLTLRCSLVVDDREDELVYTAASREARLAFRGEYASTVWPTPYEESSGESLAIATPPPTVDIRATVVQPPPEVEGHSPHDIVRRLLEQHRIEGRQDARVLREGLVRLDERLATLSRSIREISRAQRQQTATDSKLMGEMPDQLAAWRQLAAQHAERETAMQQHVASLQAAHAALVDEHGRMQRRMEELEQANRRVEEERGQLADAATLLNKELGESRRAQLRLSEVAQSRKERNDKLQLDRDRVKARAEKEKQRIEAQMARLAREIDALRGRCRVRSEQIDEMAASVRWRLGDALVKAASPSIETLKLPGTLMSLLIEGRRRRKERAQFGDAPPAAEAPPRATPAIERPPADAAAPAVPARAAAPRAAVAAPPPVVRPPRREMPVACVLDEFSYECFLPECRLTQLVPENPERQLDEIRPRMLFVESAWRGKGESWRHLVTNTKGRQDGPLRSLVHECRRRGIPTVFWNKEDPANFEHFKDSAAFFDVIFTTDSDCLPRYRELAGHDRCLALPFAAQTAIHNPIGRAGGEMGDLCFAGTWYNQKHDGRREDAEIILEPALEFGVHIYDRMHNYTGPGWQNYRWPAKYEPFIRGGLEYREMLEAYRKYHVFLNVNSVRNSPTMCARRVFEILACGTNVLSAYAPSIENLIGAECCFLTRNQQETAAQLQQVLGDEALRNRVSVRAIRRIMAEHTYVHRFSAVLRAIGEADRPMDPSVAVLLVASSADDVARGRALLAAQRYPYLRPCWIAADGLDLNGAVVTRFAASGGDAALRGALDRALTQVEADLVCLPAASAAGAGGAWLEDLVRAFAYYEGDVVGKPPGPADALLFREVESLPLRTSVLRMAAARRLGAAALASDAAFDAACRGAGLRMLATDTVERPGG